VPCSLGSEPSRRSRARAAGRLAAASLRRSAQGSYWWAVCWCCLYHPTARLSRTAQWARGCIGMSGRGARSARATAGSQCSEVYAPTLHCTLAASARPPRLPSTRYRLASAFAAHALVESLWHRYSQSGGCHLLHSAVKCMLQPSHSTFNPCVRARGRVHVQASYLRFRSRFDHYARACTFSIACNCAGRAQGHEYGACTYARVHTCTRTYSSSS
jgi:hypothetical protein